MEVSWPRRVPRIVAAHIKDASPGPCYYVQPEVTRLGRAKGPSYSMLARAKPPGLPQTPGPGTYSPEKTRPPSQRTAPSFSMGVRTPTHRVDAVPAPNTYSLPSLLGPQILSHPSSPAFTFSSRRTKGSYLQDLCRTPGPGHYQATDPSICRSRPPAFSMMGRRPKPPRDLQALGPGAHSPEKVTVHWLKAPSYSFGVCHSESLMPLVTELQGQ